jgi:hypothetical protein
LLKTANRKELRATATSSTQVDCLVPIDPRETPDLQTYSRIPHCLLSASLLNFPSFLLLRDLVQFALILKISTIAPLLIDFSFVGKVLLINHGVQ